ncbi:MAG: UPF0104 family protein [Nitrospiraceae bacterium]|nr:MAG: UPF0104 family protein [Nitrospiraceae bacterium]
MDLKVKKRLLLAILFSVCFMVVLLMKVDWRHFSLIAGRLEKKYILSSIFMFFFANFIRTLRFHKLDHTGNKILHWWNINALYNIVTATLPGGAGEAATAYILKRTSMFNILGAFRILLLSRLQDLFALAFLFFISAFFISRGALYRETAIWISGILSLMSLIAFLPPSEKFVLKLLKKLPGQNKLVLRLYEKLSELVIISEEQRSRKSYSITLFQSLVMMTAGIISIHLLLKSFGVDFTYIQSAYCYGVYMIFQVVPVQGIAGIGTKAAWWALALNTAGYRAADAIALGFILYGTLYVFIAVLGLSALLARFINRKSS